MEPRQEEHEEKEKPSRAELERLVLKLREQMRGKMKGHVDGDAEEYLFKTIVKQKQKRSSSGSRANH